MNKIKSLLFFFLLIGTTLSLTLWPQDLTNFKAQFFSRKGLLKKAYTFLQYPVSGNHIGGITGQIERFDARAAVF